MLSLPAGSRLFQSTRPRGARQTTSFGDLMAERVSIHAPARGATGNLVGLLAAKECFNPRAREGRDIANRAVESRELVSIHAPARGATKEKHYELNRQDCFNPRAREGRDKSARSLTAAKECFNPRAREGRDLFEGCFCGKKTFQSTRPRGARRRGAAGAAGSKRFNPRAREGRDPAVSILKDALAGFNPRAREGRDCDKQRFSFHNFRFNPRAREGRDQRRHLDARHTVRFNPRAREGRDFRHLAGFIIFFVFQSTRPRGARPIQVKKKPIRQKVSIHAPARGATPQYEYQWDAAQFQSTRPRGARRLNMSINGTLRSFNPRAREGRDACVRLAGAYSQRFNPRAREGRDGFPAWEYAARRVSIHAPARGATSGMVFFGSGAFCFNPRAREGRDRH